MNKPLEEILLRLEAEASERTAYEELRMIGLPEDEVFYLIGNKFASQRKFSKAVEAYEKAIQINNTKPEYFHNSYIASRKFIRYMSYSSAESTMINRGKEDIDKKMNYNCGNYSLDEKEEQKKYVIARKRVEEKY